MFLLSSAGFFQNLLFSKESSQSIRVPKGLDPDQNRHSVGLDLGKNYLQRLSADDKSGHKQGKSLH